MASINLKNKSKADLVALVRMSGVMPVTKAQRLTKAELIEQLEQLQTELPTMNPVDSAKLKPNEEEDELLRSAPGRQAARQNNNDQKASVTATVKSERRSVLVAAEPEEVKASSTGRRSVMAIPDEVEKPIESSAVKAAPKSRTRTTRSTMLAPSEVVEDKVAEAPAVTPSTEDAKSEEAVAKKTTSRTTKASSSRTTKAKTTRTAKKDETKASNVVDKVGDDQSDKVAETKTKSTTKASSRKKIQAPVKNDEEETKKPAQVTLDEIQSSDKDITAIVDADKALTTDESSKEAPATEASTTEASPATKPTTRKRKAATDRATTRTRASNKKSAEIETPQDSDKNTEVKSDELVNDESAIKLAESTAVEAVTESTEKSEKNEKATDRPAESRKSRHERNKTRNQINVQKGKQLRQEPKDANHQNAEAVKSEDKQETVETDEKKGENVSKERRIDSGEVVSGIMEIMPDGYGFLRRDNYLQGPKDIYIPPQFIRRFNLREGDLITGPTRIQRDQDRYQALYYINTVNGLPPEQMIRRPHFDRLTPIYPNQRFTLETAKSELSTRIIDLISPIGKGQRGMIVSPPKAGKTILLQKIANAISINNPEAKLIVLLIDERPEEVTDMQRSIKGEVVYSTFDKTPENHVKITELVLERAMRLVEIGEDVIILMDSLTRMARAYNLTINPTGRTLSGGLDPGALYGPKRFFGAARNIENGGSLTIVATALVDTGSRMDEVIFEEFKGTGNMEVCLDRKLSEKRIFPAIDVNKSSTRREELLLSEQELEAVWSIRRAFGSLDSSNVTETIINLLMKTNDNRHFVSSINVSLNNKSLYETMKPGMSKSNGQNNNHGV